MTGVEAAAIAVDAEVEVAPFNDEMPSLFKAEMLDLDGTLTLVWGAAEALVAAPSVNAAATAAITEVELISFKDMILSFHESIYRESRNSDGNCDTPMAMAEQMPPMSARGASDPLLTTGEEAWSLDG